MSPNADTIHENIIDAGHEMVISFVKDSALAPVGGESCQESLHRPQGSTKKV